MLNVSIIVVSIIIIMRTFIVVTFVVALNWRGLGSHERPQFGSLLSQSSDGYDQAELGAL